MVGDFDLAFLNKVRAVWPNTIYANTAITYNAIYSGGIAPDTEGKMKFPLLNVYRMEFKPNPTQTLGARLSGYNDDFIDGNKIISTRYITTNLAYQINIFAKTLEELDQLTNDILIMFSLDPNLEVKQYSRNKEYSRTEDYQVTYLNGPVEQTSTDNDDRIYTYAVVYELKNAKLMHFKEVKLSQELEIEVSQEGLDGELVNTETIEI